MFALIGAGFDLRSRFWSMGGLVWLLCAGMAHAATDAAVTGSDEAATADQSQAAAAPAAPGALQEVVVTATRRSEDIQKVPISVTAISQEQMDIQGQRDITDLQKYTPGLNISQGQGGVNEIAIRGIASGAGAATTGVYIDDTPIQSRNFGYNAGSAFPSLFDLQRVEVLRGPQGTLFGAGSEGGTVRAILPQPSLTTYTEYARAEGLHIDHGGNGGEAGFEISGPIVDDHVGFLASVFYRRDAGYINAVTGTYTIVDPSGATAGNAIKFPSTSTYQRNANWDEVKGARFALKIQPFEGLQITPSLIYQDRWFNQADSSFWLAASNLSSGDLDYVAYPAGDPATTPRLTPQYGPNLEQSGEHWLLPSLAVQWDLGPVQLIYNGSYFKRDQYAWRDYTILYEYLYGSPVPPAGDHANGLIPNSQGNLVQEVRLQSTDATGRFTWVVGAFYSRDKQSTNDIIGENFTQNLSPFTFTLGFPPTALSAVGSPTGRRSDPAAPAFKTTSAIRCCSRGTSRFLASITRPRRSSPSTARTISRSPIS